ncbi:MMPL family transporter [Rhodococcoides kyotonense]|uniref:Putative drug exporter of the RND superfamily n=1 Tax=Rhodococcoides kyotonense TaxID=398843 RepID=A0A239MLX8_9NOCA|nr:MMPL family transporter [Rhodococcus kyotonensis]SNT43263.1 putative drug exporter of the RND superfamily [Rhodococcus kyotonensis]
MTREDRTASRNRLAQFVVRRARLVVASCVVVIVLAGIWGFGVLHDLSLGGYSDPGSEAARVDEIVEAQFGRQVPDVAILYTPTDGRTVDDIRGDVEQNLSDVDASLLARDPVSYWNMPPAIAQGLKSFDGRSALAVLTMNGDEDARVKTFLDIRDDLAIDGVDVQFGGFATIADAYNTEARADLIRAETITFPILMVLLLVIFGGVTAAAVPLCIGGLSILASLAVMRVLANFTEVSIFATNIATLVGLGMAVDYSLFVLTRFREELRRGASAEEAVHRTMATAGRTVAFSALLLVCGFVGMLIFPQAMIRSLGFGGMAAVAVSAFVSLTALPATLALLGPRINSLSWRAGAADRGDARAERFWGSVAERVMRRPVVVATAIFALLALLAAPIAGVALGDLDHTGLPPDAPARIATDKLFADFPLANSGVTIMVQSENGSPPDALVVQQLAAEMGRVDGIAAALPSGSADDYGVIRAILTSPDRTQGALDTVTRLRAVEAPEGTDIRIGGATALSQDGITSIYDTIPWMFAIMIAATFVVTTAAFRSIVLSAKAIAMAMLSLAATFGVLTWVFHDGHGAGIIGVTPGPLQATMSILIMAVVFGLSTDYEIFLLSRIVEAHDVGATTREAVKIGAARTGRVVTAAALLLITVTAFFSLSELAMMRLVGIGIIIGLILDATVVRMLLVPALVALMGEANWWLHPRKTVPEQVSRPLEKDNENVG